MPFLLGGSYHAVESLIRAGVPVNVRDDPKTSVDSTSGYTPLYGAGFFGNKEAASVLMRHGADVRVREERYHGTNPLCPLYTEGWYTPLAFAVVRGDAETTQLLLKCGANPAVRPRRPGAD